MTDDTWLFISKCLSELEKQNDIFEQATNGLMITPESPLIEPFFINLDTTLRSLSFISGDCFDSLSWFVYECNYGRDAKEAGKKDKIRLIDTHKKLRWLIEISNEP